VKQISDNETYLLIKYIKSVLWRVAKQLSYIEDAGCLKVNGQKMELTQNQNFPLLSNDPLESFFIVSTCFEKQINFWKHEI